MAVCIDGLRKISENIGSEGGDALLRDIGVRFKNALRDVDTVARVGGNEYGVLVESVSTGDVSALAEKLAEALATPFEVHGQEAFVTASIGVATHSSINSDA